MDNNIDFLGLSASWFGQGLFLGKVWKPYSRVQRKEHWAQLESPGLTASHSSALFMLCDLNKSLVFWASLAHL